MRQPESFNCSMASVTHSSPKLSQANTSTGRAPSIDHSAISTAPVSEAGTIAILKSAGTPSSTRVLSIASLSLALPGLERCERPSNAPSRALRFHPGRFLVGPDENRASAGRTPGGGMCVIECTPILTDERPPLGADGPLRRIENSADLSMNSSRVDITSGHKRMQIKPNGDLPLRYNFDDITVRRATYLVFNQYRARAQSSSLDRH